MQNTLRGSWTCTRCLKRQQIGRKFLATAAAVPNHIPDPAPLTAASLDHDDRALRQIFDSKAFWSDFSSRSQATWTRKSVGLLGNHHLKTPQGFEQFAHLTLEKCRRLVTKVLGISSRDGYIGIVQDLDRLSDLLCRIIDLADFVRSTHPDPAYQRAATQAHILMFEYMNTLNTTTGLNDQLKTALSDPEITKHWSEEEMRVAQILKRDFSKSAIDLPAAKRQKFIDLSNDINELGSRFLDDMSPKRPVVSFLSSDSQGIDPVLLRRCTNHKGKVTIPSVGGEASHILRHAENEHVRRDVYIASRTSASGQIGILEALLHKRAELAQLSGFRSYSELALSDKMAQTPEAVVKFLDALTADNAPLMKEELELMLQLKRQQSNADSTGRINAWDREYYRSRIASSLAKEQPSRSPDFLPAYFSLGTVMQGLSRLFNRLYGVRFVPREPQPGETWTPEVRRLDVIDETEGLIAVVYCDLFARAGKSPNPAHFTVRCSRHIPYSEILEASQHRLSSPPTTDPLALANDGMATTAGPNNSANQLPTIALICDFPPPSPSRTASGTTPPLLPVHHLITLFHEMGHAIHSVLGRTKLQNVAGTRCATDFAELPSVLMERFATHPDALALYARHWETDAPLPAQSVQKLQPRTGVEGRAERMAAAADEEAQVRLALLDQAFHGEDARKKGFSTDAVALEVDRRTALVREPEEARWQGFFGHLVGYGGAYYAYLFDRAIAARVWEVVFAGGEGGPVGREKGERFRGEVLKWGGGRDGWACVEGVLGERGRGLGRGGEKAMEEVGRWGLGL
ncbi:MAG: Mitochondrial intermediate peptidase [Stictis urceolatum]|nr:Mitochondrial intermediate peptidase [Stictis urceolata]